MIPYSKPCIDEATKMSIKQYVDSDGWLTEYKITEAFEQAVCDYTGAEHAVAMCNGTMGLYAALKVCGIDSEDIVAAPAYTFVGTYNSIALTKAKMLEIFVEDDTLCMEYGALSQIIEYVDAVILVSLNGRYPHHAEDLFELCEDRGVFVIEDACQSFGSTYQGRHIGTFGDIGVYSFAPQKIITTGQGCVCVTNNQYIAKRLRQMKNFGRIHPDSDYYEILGFNFKFTDLQAAAGLGQLTSMQERIEKSRKLYKKYYDALGGLPLQEGQAPIAFEYFNSLKSPNKIQFREFYPNEANVKGVWLPFYPYMTEEESDKVISWIQSRS